MGNHQRIQIPIEGQPNKPSDGQPNNAVGGSFRRDHGQNLISIHAQCPHNAILLDSGRYTEKNAVHNIQNRNHGNDRQKSIDKKRKGPIRVI